MTEPVKLLDENLEFNSAALEFLQDSSVNYLVVGVLGILQKQLSILFLLYMNPLSES